MKTLTLHLEEREARALVMRGSRVIRWASLPIPPGVINSGVVVNPKALAAVLRLIFKLVQAGRMRPLVSLSGLHPVVRILSLPPLKRNLLAEAVQREMKRELPIPIEHYHISWKPLASSGPRASRLAQADAKETKIYTLAVPSGELESCMAAFKLAQLSPRSISLEPLVVASVLNLETSRQVGTVAAHGTIIIGMKDTGFSIVILQNGVPTIMRDITYPQENLSMAERVADLGKELQLTMASFGLDRPEDPNRGLGLPEQDESRDLGIAQAEPRPSGVSLYILGKNTDDDYLIGYMAQQIGIPLSIFSPAVSYPEDFPVAEYAANLALALCPSRPVDSFLRTASGDSLLQGGLAFDLTPHLRQPSIVPRRQAALLVALTVALGGVISPLRGVLEPSAQGRQLRSQVLSYQQGIDEAQGRIRAAREAAASVAKEKAEADQLQNSLQQIDRQHLLWPSILRDAARAFPTIQLLSFWESSTSLTIAAQAPSTAEAVALATHLEATGLFSSVTIPNLTRDTQASSAKSTRFSVIASKGG